MQIIKKLIRLPFNLIGLQIVNMNVYIFQQQNISYIMETANKYYKYSLDTQLDFLTDSEYLQYLELKYGGYIKNVSATIKSSDVSRFRGGPHTGGDRFNVFFHNYSEKYSQYLKPLRQSQKLINIVEIGILKGTGLAIWDEYFEYKKIYGFDYDICNFEHNKSKLIELGAFKKDFPIIKFFDQFADNSDTLKITFGLEKIDVVIDDAYHSDESIINSFNELQPYLNKEFIYFIEDNRTAWRKLQMIYPNYNFDNTNNNELTVVTNKCHIKK